MTLLIPTLATILLSKGRGKNTAVNAVAIIARMNSIAALTEAADDFVATNTASERGVNSEDDVSEDESVEDDDSKEKSLSLKMKSERSLE